jgi:hypothetical protein
MKLEFHRYGLSRYRQLTGYLEVLGGAGLIVGHYHHIILSISSAGLAVLMFLGVLVRLKSKDAMIEIAPAFILLTINVFIFFKSLDDLFIL